MFEPYVESALAHRQAPSGLGIEFREIRDRGMVDLRGLPGDKKFLSIAKDVLGLDLPRAPRTSASWGDIKALWLSLDQWLILCSRAKAIELQAQLAARLEGVHALAVDVSDMRAVIRLEGEGVREVLLKGASLDLLGADYPPGTVRRLRFAEIAALLHIVEETIVDLYVFRSYADHAWDFLMKAANPAAKMKLFIAQSATR